MKSHFLKLAAIKLALLLTVSAAAQQTCPYGELWDGIKCKPIAIPGFINDTSGAPTWMEFPGTIDTAMTPQQRKAAGVNKLTAAQEKAFNAWLQDFVLGVVSKTWKSSQDAAYAQVEELINHVAAEFTDTTPKPERKP